MKTDSGLDSEPVQPPTRTRSGLAKLRGAPEVSPPEPSDSANRAPETIDGARVPEADSAAADTVSLPEPESAVGRPAVPRRVGRRMLLGVIALVVAAAVMLGFVIARWDGGKGSGTSTSGGSQTAQADTGDRFAALQAARQFSVSFFTYDYRNVDAYFRRVEAASTGSFRSDFVSKEATLKTVLTKLKTVASGQVADTGAGIFALADGKAIAFVAPNLNASNATTKNGQRRYRVKLTLQQVKGKWLVSDFQEVV